MNNLSFLWANNILSHSQSKLNYRVTNKTKSWLTKLSSFALILELLESHNIKANVSAIVCSND